MILGQNLIDRKHLEMNDMTICGRIDPDGKAWTRRREFVQKKYMMI